jgi:hypothetical protein
MFRLNRIKPHGEAARRNARSSAVIAGPDNPVMKARGAIAAA